MRISREITPEKAYSKLMILCGRSEKCSFDVLTLLKRWAISSSDAESILESLKRDKFIDDTRYAKMYVRDKSRLNGWGASKIKSMLFSKGMSSDIITIALGELKEADVKDKIRQIVKKKYDQLVNKEDDKYKLRSKLFNFAASKGYDFDDINHALDQLNLM